MIHLDMVLGPACVRCGCQDVTILSAPQAIEATDTPGVATAAPVTWNVPGRAACNHCGTHFPIQQIDPPSSVYSGPLCPECGSDNTTCTKSPKASDNGEKVRYHKCRDCGGNFKTSESCRSAQASS